MPNSEFLPLMKLVRRVIAVTTEPERMIEDSGIKNTIRLVQEVEQELSRLIFGENGEAQGVLETLSFEQSVLINCARTIADITYCSTQFAWVDTESEDVVLKQIELCMRTVRRQGRLFEEAVPYLSRSSN